MKRKLFKAIARYLGVKEGEKYPKWLLILFYPFRYYGVAYSGISYDFGSDIYLIEGVRYSGEFFRQFSKGLQPGDYFRFVKRENETIYIERVEQ